MTWILLALFAQVMNATKNVLTRRLGNDIDTYTVAFVSTVLMLPFLWLSVFLSGDLTIEPGFWKIMVLIVPLEIVVMLLFFHALTKSELSVSYPFVGFSPLFVAFGSFLILGEVNSWLLYVGMLLLVLGAFAHQLKDESALNVKGALYILAVCALWGYMIPMGNLAMGYATPQLFPALFFSLATVLFFPVWLYTRTSSYTAVRSHAGLFLLIGLVYALFMGANWLAFSLGPVTAVAALGMLSILFTSMLSGVYLKERLTIRRLAAAILMCAGAILIVVS